jgi:hypothetical protein
MANVPTPPARVDENLFASRQIRSFDQRLPRRQADQGDRCRFFHREGFRLDRDVGFFGRNELRECTDSPVSRPRIDFVAECESSHSRSDPDHDPGDVMAQDERQTIRKNALELAVSDLGIQKIDTCGVYLDQYVILAQLRIRHVASPHMVGAAITIEDECLHRCSLPSRHRRLASHNESSGSGWDACELPLEFLRIREERRSGALTHLVGERSLRCPR